MKVITHPTAYTTTQHIACPNCKATLEISASDLQPAPKFEVYSYTCLCCKQTQYIKAKDLIQGVKDGLKVHKHHFD